MSGVSGVPLRALAVLATAELRRHWRSLLALGILVGLAGAGVVSATAAARRTSSAYDRLRDATNVDDARVVSINAVPPEQVSALPEVVASRQARMGVGQLAGPGVTYIAVQSLAPEPAGLSQPVLISGRPYRSGAPGEAVMTERAALRGGIRPGDVVRLKMLMPEEVLQFATGFGQPDGPAVELRITGLVRVPGPAIETAPVLASPAFAARHPEPMSAGHVSYLRLRDGAGSVPAVQAALDRLTRDLPPTGSPLPPLELLRPDDAASTVRATARVLSRGLLVFAAVAGAVGLLTAALAFLRYQAGRADAQRVEAALGLTSVERVAARAMAGILTAAAAAVVCAAASLAFAVIDPAGPMERYEPHPGWAPNAVLIALGSAATALVALALVAVTARRAGRAEPARAGAGRPWRLPGAPWVATGVRFALESRGGRRRIPVRSSLAGVVVGVLGVVGCAVFAASRDGLVDDHARWGWTADAAILNVTDPVVDRLVADDRLHDVAVTQVTSVRVGDGDVTGYAITPVKGSLGWTTPSGRVPTGPSEVTLGRRLAGRLDAGVGDAVTVGGPPGARFTVVGVGYGPSLARDRFGDNLLVTSAGLDRVRRTEADREALVRAGPGTDAEELRRQLAQTYEIAGPEPPAEVSNLDALGRLPSVLGVCLAVIAAVALSHLLLVTARRRAWDLAVLRVIGFTPGQARSSILVMALTSGVVGTASGIVLGIGAGRMVWNAVVDALGIPTAARVPVTLLLGAALAMPVVAVLVALLPARRAGAVRPAVLLREE